MDEHRCQPTVIGGPPHTLRADTVYLCGCGKEWFVTRRDWNGVCGCGWAHVTNKGALDDQLLQR